MADKSVSVDARGLKELAASLKSAGDMMPHELRNALLGIAKEVRDVAAQRMPWKTGAAARSVRASATPQGASVSEGGPTAPYVPWLDFGGSVGRGHRPGVQWSGSVPKNARLTNWYGKPSGIGRVIYPAVVEEKSAIIDGTFEAVDRVMREAGYTRE